jgi:hypothetical protein
MNKNENNLPTKQTIIDDFLRWVKRQPVTGELLASTMVARYTKEVYGPLLDTRGRETIAADVEHILRRYYIDNIGHIYWMNKLCQLKS